MAKKKKNRKMNKTTKSFINTVLAGIVVNIITELIKMLAHIILGT